MKKILMIALFATFCISLNAQYKNPIYTVECFKDSIVNTSATKFSPSLCEIKNGIAIKRGSTHYKFLQAPIDVKLTDGIAKIKGSNSTYHILSLGQTPYSKSDFLQILKDCGSCECDGGAAYIDPDNDPTNEYNISATLTGTLLSIDDGGGSIGVELSSLTSESVYADLNNGKVIGTHVSASGLIGNVEETITSIGNTQQGLQGFIYSNEVGSRYLYSIDTTSTSYGYDLTFFFNGTGVILPVFDGSGFVDNDNQALETNTPLVTVSTDANDNHTLIFNPSLLTDEVNDADFDPTNEIELPTGGTNGQVLATNGSGVYSWVTDQTGTGNGGADGVISNVTYAESTNTLTFTGQNGGFNGQVSLSELDEVPENCQVGETLQWDGANWVCVQSNTKVCKIITVAGHGESWASSGGALSSDASSMLTVTPDLNGYIITDAYVHFGASLQATSGQLLVNLSMFPNASATSTAQGQYGTVVGAPAANSSHSIGLISPNTIYNTFDTFILTTQAGQGEGLSATVCFDKP